MSESQFLALLNLVSATTDERLLESIHADALNLLRRHAERTLTLDANEMARCFDLMQRVAHELHLRVSQREADLAMDYLGGD